MRSVISRTFALFAAAVLAFGSSFAASLEPQSSSQSGVTVKVTPPRSVAGAEWEFAVVFDTHSQDLKDDLMKSAVLVVDDGAPLAPSAWQGDAPGGHHRKAVLRFKAPAASPAKLELRLQRTGESGPRTFRWQLR